MVHQDGRHKRSQSHPASSRVLSVLCSSPDRWEGRAFCLHGAMAVRRPPQDIPLPEFGEAANVVVCPGASSAVSGGRHSRMSEERTPRTEAPSPSEPAGYHLGRPSNHTLVSGVTGSERSLEF